MPIYLVVIPPLAIYERRKCARGDQRVKGTIPSVMKVTPLKMMRQRVDPSLPGFDRSCVMRCVLHTRGVLYTLEVCVTLTRRVLDTLGV